MHKPIMNTKLHERIADEMSYNEKSFRAKPQIQFSYTVLGQAYCQHLRGQIIV